MSKTSRRTNHIPQRKQIPTREEEKILQGIMKGVNNMGENCTSAEVKYTLEEALEELRFKAGQAENEKHFHEGQMKAYWKAIDIIKHIENPNITRCDLPKNYVFTLMGKDLTLGDVGDYAGSDKGNADG